MKILKGLSLGLAGFFLFAALFTLGPVFTLHSTALSPHFVINEVGKLDVTAVTQQIVDEQLPSEAQPYTAEINATINELQPWIDEQISYVVNTTYDYLSGKTNALNITISTQPVKPSLVKNLTQIYTQSPGYLQLSPAEQTQLLDQFQQQVLSTVPSNITLNQDNIPPAIMKTIQEAKNIFGYIRNAYFGLIVFCILLILLIILITREFKSATLSMGIIFIAGGALSLIAFAVLNNVVPGMIPVNNFPSQVQSWLPQVIKDILSSWSIFGIAVLVIGILLLVLSFFLHRRQIWPAGVSNG